MRFAATLVCICLGALHATAAEKPKEITLQKGVLMCDTALQVMQITALKKAGIPYKRGRSVVRGCGFLQEGIRVEVTTVKTFTFGDTSYTVVRWEGAWTDNPAPRRKKKRGRKYTTCQYGVGKTVRLTSA